VDPDRPDRAVRRRMDSKVRRDRDVMGREVRVDLEVRVKALDHSVRSVAILI
jgi:hypothetical protein